MNLFISLYLDEDVDVLVAPLVRSKGFDALTVREAGKLGEDDEEQLAYAVLEKRALLTHNRADFLALAQAYASANKTHYGIFLAVRHPPYEVARRVLLILNHVTADEMLNQVRYI